MSSYSIVLALNCFWYLFEKFQLELFQVEEQVVVFKDLNNIQYSP